MSNMSYVRFRNTVGDLADCTENLYDELSEDEARARRLLIKVAYEMVSEFLTDEGQLDMDAVNNLPVEKGYDDEEAGVPDLRLGYGLQRPPEDMLPERLLGMSQDWPGGSHKINLIKALRIHWDCSLVDAKNKIEELFDFSTGEPLIK